MKTGYSPWLHIHYRISSGQTEVSRCSVYQQGRVGFYGSCQEGHHTSCRKALAETLGETGLVLLGRAGQGGGGGRVSGEGEGRSGQRAALVELRRSSAVRGAPAVPRAGLLGQHGCRGEGLRGTQDRGPVPGAVGHCS